MGRASKKPAEPVFETLHIESVDLEAQGIARRDGKVAFVQGALTSETVVAQITGMRPKFDKAVVTEVLQQSSLRVAPRCKHFGVCGGCSMQHIDPHAQLAMKQRALEDSLWHLGRIRPEKILAPIAGPNWGYRYRARLSVRHVAKKGGVLVGFHERGSSYVADMTECHVLPPHVARLLVPLRELFAQLDMRDRMPQIELAVGQGDTVMVLRVLDAATDADRAKLLAFARAHGINFWLQPKGPETIYPLDPAQPGNLHYTLPEFDVRMPFAATDFTQVNHQINRVLVGQAIGLLDVHADHRVLDLFCGLGNFTLPLARKAAQVFGVEGSGALIKRAGQNAAHNGLADKVSYDVRNLFEVTAQDLRSWGRFDRWLIDPPREGGIAVVKALAELGHAERPPRIVYVSCNPATLARDATVLVNEAGYALKAAGVVNMFPHTSHVESMAVFELLPEKV
ncbi:MAG: 23S rRNA (uracil(1939)-C(5))-methyltransferase RlmD [Burkholderiaceae bacterium]